MTMERAAYRILAALTVPLLAGQVGCGTQSDASTPPPAPPRTAHYVAILDRSTSITPSEEQAFRRSVAEIVEGLEFGDRFTFFVAYSEGRRDGTGSINRDMPGALNPAFPAPAETRALESARESLRRATTPLLDAPPTDYTDLLSSLRTAEEYFRASPSDDRVLVLFSDMLHCTRQSPSLCMESSGWRATPEDLAGALDGVCVWVLGADASTAMGTKAREYWLGYFQAAGAEASADRYDITTCRNRCGRIARDPVADRSRRAAEPQRISPAVPVCTNRPLANDDGLRMTQGGRRSFCGSAALRDSVVVV